MVSFGIFMIMKYVIVLVMAVQKTVIYEYNGAIMMMIFAYLEVIKECL